MPPSQTLSSSNPHKSVILSGAQRSRRTCSSARTTTQSQAFQHNRTRNQSYRLPYLYTAPILLPSKPAPFILKHMKSARLLLCLAAVLCFTASAHAIEIKVSAQALERTLNTQLFNGEDGRYYFRGNATSACYAYAYEPKVSFKDERIVIHVKTHARLGAQINHECIGVDFKNDADVSVIPDAQGEFIGFRDPRIDSRKLLATSAQATGYDMKLDNLKIHSMQVSGDALVVDFDGDLSVH
jgi:hypothetical protein